MTNNEIKAKLTDFSEIVQHLPENLQQTAFGKLVDNWLLSGGVAPAGPPAGKPNSPRPANTSVEATPEEMSNFFNAHPNQKPADNVLLIVAWLYNQHGNLAFTPAMVKPVAAEAGLVIADRCDNTMRQAAHKGKQLFSKSGNGWKLTLAGMAQVAEQYKVRPGRKPFLDLDASTN